jgi:cell division protein FtsI (penicillin-binding protein 3)
MSGVVFHHIAEGVMAQSLKLKVTDARDSLSVLVPQVKTGNILAADYVLTHLGIRTNNGWDGSYADGNPIWGKAETGTSSVTLEKEPLYSRSVVPDVSGMGARDAVYMLETRGLKVRVNGRGKVTKQSLPIGHKVVKGEVIQLDLQ